MKKTILVTGGAGFVGSHLVDALVARGDRIIVVDKVYPKDTNRNVQAEYIKMNIQDDGVYEIFNTYKPELLFHLAAHLHDRVSIADPIANAEDNVLGFLNVCEANRKTSRAKIVFMSSCAVYGVQNQVLISETAIPEPRTPYGITKRVGEHYLQFYQNIENIPFVAFRAGNIYGPRQDSSAESGVVGIFSARCLEGEPVILNNDGRTTRDYVYISDVVAALLKAGDTDVNGVFNIGTGIETQTNQILRLVEEAGGIKAEGKQNENQQDVLKQIALNVSLAKEALGWEAQVALKEGIKKTVAWYRGQKI